MMPMGVCGECAAHMGGFVAHRRKRGKMKFLLKTEVLGKKWSFWSKMKFLVKNEVFVKKWSFRSKVKFLVKGEVFGQKWSFWSKVKFLVKSEVFGQRWSFQSKIMPMGVCGECAAYMGGFVAHRRKHGKMKFLVKNEVFGKKWSFWWKMGQGALKSFGFCNFVPLLWVGHTFFFSRKVFMRS